jgi:ADP-heptose:LPS heptosyltransferase
VHLVIDMQGVQVDLDSGRYCRGTLLLLKEIARHRDGIRVTLAVSDLLPNTIATVLGEFTDFLPADRIRIWHAVRTPLECDDESSWRCEVTDRIRDAFLASVQPDAILKTAPFKRSSDGFCAHNGKLCEEIPLAVLAEYSGCTASQNPQVASDDVYENRFGAGSQFPDHSVAFFTICDFAPPEFCPAPPMHASKLHTLPAAESEAAANAEIVLGMLREKAGNRSRHISSRLCVEETGIFTQRKLRILAIKIDHLGDFLLAIPALAKLRAKYPHAILDVVVGSWNVGIAKQLGFFENVHCFDFFKRKSSANASINAEELAELVSNLPDYDIAIDMRRQSESRFFLSRVGAKLKVGYQTLDASIDECLDIALPVERDAAHKRTILNQTPISLQILRLVDSLPGDVNDFVRLPALGPPGVRQDGTVAIFPKAGTDVREWNRKKCVDLIRRLVQSDLIKTVHMFFVNSSEAAEYRIDLSEKIEVHVGLEFSSLTTILSSVNLCIANNSGGIHLAAYLGVPVIGIYSGHETASEWGPQFHAGLVIHRNAHCSPCHLGRLSDCRNGNFCLDEIAVEDVYAKAVEVLAVSAREEFSLSTWLPDGVVKQLNEDGIVKSLISEITPFLSTSNKGVLIQVAAAIAENHPSYRVPPESDTFRMNTTVDHCSSAIEWIGFSASERNFRWTDGKHAAMMFDVDLEGEIAGEASILLVFDTLRKQRIVAKFNGVKIFDAVRSGRRLLMGLPVRNVLMGRNRLEFDLPDATSPGNGDSRQLAVAVRRFKLLGTGAQAPGILRRAERIKEFLIRWR